MESAAFEGYLMVRIGIGFAPVPFLGSNVEKTT
jgi:hypothetical protein